MFAPNLPTPFRGPFGRDRPTRSTPCPLFDGVGMNLCSLVVVDAHESTNQPTLRVSSVLLSPVEGQRTLVVEHGV